MRYQSIAARFSLCAFVVALAISLVASFGTRLGFWNYETGFEILAPGVGIGNQEDFIYQCRAFLDQIAGTPDPLPANATFADALHTMGIIEAIVRSVQSDGAAVPVAPDADDVAGASGQPAAPTNPA